MLLGTMADCVAACCNVSLVPIFTQRVAHVLYALPQRMGSRKVDAYDE